MNSLDRLFWTTLRRFRSCRTGVLGIVNPESVIGWRRAGFRLNWRWRSRPRSGRPKITEEIRVPIRRLAEENPDWGAPKTHGELQKPGIGGVSAVVETPPRAGWPLSRRGSFSLISLGPWGILTVIQRLALWFGLYARSRG